MEVNIVKLPYIWLTLNKYTKFAIEFQEDVFEKKEEGAGSNLGTDYKSAPTVEKVSFTEQNCFIFG